MLLYSMLVADCDWNVFAEINGLGSTPFTQACMKIIKSLDSFPAIVKVEVTFAVI